MKINEKCITEILMRFCWKSNYADHEDCYFARVNIWREVNLFPKEICETILDKEEGDILKFDIEVDKLYPFEKNKIFKIDPRSHYRPPEKFAHLKLRLGRFYPLGFFKFLPGIYEGNPFPGRIIFEDKEKGTYILDANHPLCGYSVQLNIEILKVYPKERELGGRCKDWIEEAFRIGPGMQVRYDQLPTDFGWNEPESFLREDQTDDALFYKIPRFVSHIDRLCHKHLVEYYSQILPKKGIVLDLMSSFESHLPDNNFEVIGLGINREELAANPKLSNFLVKDLNKDPSLPFENNTFDAVICDLSIEYVIKPFELLSEIRRILKPKGIISFSFSNRYFPPKVIKLWIDLHEFERMGYVLELLIKTGFKNLHTYSLRGFPRPVEDFWIKYTKLSDPLYVVWGQKF